MYIIQRNRVHVLHNIGNNKKKIVGDLECSTVFYFLTRIMFTKLKASILKCMLGTKDVAKPIFSINFCCYLSLSDTTFVLVTCIIEF